VPSVGRGSTAGNVARAVEGADEIGGARCGIVTFRHHVRRLQFLRTDALTHCALTAIHRGAGRRFPRIRAGALLALREGMAIVLRKQLPHAEVSEQIIEGFHEVVRELGCGFGEKVCQRALYIVLVDRGLTVESDAPLEVRFRGRRIGRFFADLIVNDAILLDVKALPTLDNYATAQILNYLRVLGGGVGFLMNFGRQPTYKRFVVGDPTNSLPLLAQMPRRSSVVASVAGGAGQGQATCGETPAAEEY
jgi:GxxExxY protein